MALYTDDGRSFIVDRSGVNPNGLFFRISHAFGPQVELHRILEALRADELWLAELHRLEL